MDALVGVGGGQQPRAQAPALGVEEAFTEAGVVVGVVLVVSAVEVRAGASVSRSAIAPIAPIASLLLLLLLLLPLPLLLRAP